MGRQAWGASSWRRVRLAGAVPVIVLAFAISGCGGGGGSTTTSEGTAGAGDETATATEEAGTKNGGSGAAEAEAGAKVFASAGCGSCHAFKAAGSTGTTGPDLNEYLEPDDNKAGIEEMIVDPNAEIAEGYTAGVMPENFGETLSSQEVKELVAFLYENSPASEKQTGEQGEQESEGK